MGNGVIFVANVCEKLFWLFYRHYYKKNFISYFSFVISKECFLYLLIVRWVLWELQNTARSKCLRPMEHLLIWRLFYIDSPIFDWNDNWNVSVFMLFILVMVLRRTCTKRSHDKSYTTQKVLHIRLHGMRRRPIHISWKIEWQVREPLLYAPNTNAPALSRY